MFKGKYRGSVSIRTIKRVKSELWWVDKHTHNCTMTVERNKKKKVESHREQIKAGDLRFTNVVWMLCFLLRLVLLQQLCYSTL